MLRISNKYGSVTAYYLGSDAYFEYTSCYFKVVTLFIRNLYRVRLPYLLNTSGPPQLRTGAILLLKCFSTIAYSLPR
jgi:hypothetical protein